METNLEKFAPLFQEDEYSEEEKKNLSPFFTNLDKSVYAPLIFSPELIGALCSRTSRAAQDLRNIFLKEYINPFIKPQREEADTDESWSQKEKYGKNLQSFIDFLHGNSILDLFANPRARSFYTKWLAQYGDDSIAQMAGSHLVYSSISQIGIKHFEDQRIGLAPIEKSTRYVNYGEKVKGSYLYYADPTLKEIGLEREYKAAMDNLFETYKRLLPQVIAWLSQKFPEEKPAVVEKKAFDTLRGLLPVATLSQVAFFGNGQAFEYMISRSLKHPLGEIRWVGQRAFEELNQVTPSFMRRLEKETSQDYQNYLSGKGEKMKHWVKSDGKKGSEFSGDPEVRLVEFDPEGEEKIITGMLFFVPGNQDSWNEIFQRVKKMGTEEKKKIIASYLEGRTARWQKVGRAFENAFVRFEIIMNIGAWRDLQRHRMLTQQRQEFSCAHGYDLPHELREAKLDEDFRQAIKKAEEIYEKISKHSTTLAQYAVTFAHRLQFMHLQNMRSLFWTTELRTIPEGHPDYRHVEQKKFKHLQKIYPLIAEHMLVNMGEYDFARRGQDEKIQKKMGQLLAEGENVSIS